MIIRSLGFIESTVSSISAPTIHIAHLQPYTWNTGLGSIRRRHIELDVHCTIYTPFSDDNVFAVVENPDQPFCCSGKMRVRVVPFYDEGQDAS
jgi:hypothetical protein